jgi:hypothetical protein
VSDIDTAAVDSLKALDPEWPIREAMGAISGRGRCALEKALLTLMSIEKLLDILCRRAKSGHFQPDARRGAGALQRKLRACPFERRTQWKCKRLECCHHAFDACDYFARKRSNVYVESHQRHDPTD